MDVAKKMNQSHLKEYHGVRMSEEKVTMSERRDSGRKEPTPLPSCISPPRRYFLHITSRLQARESSAADTMSCPVKAQSVKGSVVSREVRRLSKEQRQVILENYAYMKREANQNGLALFVRMFAEYPHYKNIWPQFRAIPDSSLVSSDALRRHACVYMGGLQDIMDSLEDDHKLSEVTRRIARSHVVWGIYKYHIEHMVPELLCVLSQCVERKLTEEEMEAWTTLYDIIGNLIDQFKRGDYSHH